jgi:hypothetical protein
MLNTLQIKRENIMKDIRAKAHLVSAGSCYLVLKEEFHFKGLPLQCIQSYFTTNSNNMNHALSHDLDYKIAQQCKNPDGSPIRLSTYGVEDGLLNVAKVCE